MWQPFGIASGVAHQYHASEKDSRADEKRGSVMRAYQSSQSQEHGELRQLLQGDVMLTRRQAIGALAATASAALTGCAQAGAGAGTQPAADTTRTIRILATSDLHGKMLPYSYPSDEEDASGSLAQVASAVAQLRDEHTLVIDVGDTIQDNMAEIFAHDEAHPMIVGLNAVGYDIGVLGNHEFNYGMDVVRWTVASFDGTVLTGNVIDEHGDAVAESATIRNVGGVRVGIIGMVTPNIQLWDAANLEGCVVFNPVRQIRKAIELIEDEVDVLVGAFHVDIESQFGVPGSGARELAEKFPQFDVILAAHGHRLVEGELIGTTLVVENLSQGKSMAHVQIACERSDEGWKVVDKSSTSVNVADYEPDAEIVELLAPYDERARSFAHEVVGRLEGGPLTAEAEIVGIPTPQIEDTALIDLINKVMLHYSGADVAVAELVAPDANIQPGEIRRCDVSKIYKYTNTLYTLRMTGAQLRRFMEWSAGVLVTWQPGDVTFAIDPERRCYEREMPMGVTYEIDVSREVGERIRNLCWQDGRPVADDDSFVLAVNNYRSNSLLLAPGMLFEEDDMPKLLASDLRSDIGGIREMVADYIENVCGGVIRPECDHNWKLVGYEWDPELHERAVAYVRAGKIELEGVSQWGLCNKPVTVDDLAAVDG